MLDVNEAELIPTRATLIHRLKNWRDDSSWQVFFDTYWRLIYGMAIKAGIPPSEAQDIVQETVISVAKHMPTFEYDPSIGSFKAWLFNMTRWRIVDHLRKLKRKPTSLDSKEEATDETQAINRIPDPATQAFDAVWKAEWEKNLLHTAVGLVKRQVDPQKYQIFDFYVNKEWSPEKVAEKFGVSVDQVYLNKHRITGLIKAEVKRIEADIR